MRLYLILLILFVVSCTPQIFGDLKAQNPPSCGVSSEESSDGRENDFKVTDITLATIQGSNYLKVTIIDRNSKGGVYAFPTYEVVSDGVLIGELEPNSYDLQAHGTKKIPTTLTTLPDDFECIVHISAAEETLPLYELPYKAPKKEEASSRSDNINVPAESENTENLFEVSSIEFVTIEGENYLRIDIKDLNPNGQFYPYPCYKVVSSSGEVIGELDFISYGLTGPENIPTTLSTLPDNFECVVHLNAHGGMAVENHELVYKSK